MSEFHDDDTQATSPGGLSLSEAKLRSLQPELLEGGTFKCSPLCPIDHAASEMRERIAEHLRIGDVQPAVVVSVDPLVVSARSVDLDAVALLRFPDTFARLFNLHVGARLVSVNTYTDVISRDGRTPLFAADLVPGPRRSGWSNFSPLIGEFLSDDDEVLRTRRYAIPEQDWTRLAENTRVRLERGGTVTARDGRPTRAGFPVPFGDEGVVFRTLEKLLGPVAAAKRRSLTAQQVLGMVFAALAMALGAYFVRK
jgi:hypothetical protein